MSNAQTRLDGLPNVRRLARAVLGHMPRHLALPILSGPLRGCLWTLRSANYSCWLGTYERSKQRLFAREVSRGAVVYDIGAHVGFYAILAARLSGSTGKVVAYEPLPSNVAMLRRHAELNHLSIEVVQAAVADRDGYGSFHEGPDTYTGTLSDSGQSISVVSIDGTIAANPFPYPDLIKIDVEGAEALVLLGASRTLRRSHPTIFVAVHSDALRARCIELLAAIGYRVSTVDGDSNELIARPPPTNGRAVEVHG